MTSWGGNWGSQGDTDAPPHAGFSVLTIGGESRKVEPIKSSGMHGPSRLWVVGKAGYLLIKLFSPRVTPRLSPFAGIHLTCEGHFVLVSIRNRRPERRGHHRRHPES